MTKSTMIKIRILVLFVVMSAIHVLLFVTYVRAGVLFKTEDGLLWLRMASLVLPLVIGFIPICRTVLKPTPPLSIGFAVFVSVLFGWLSFLGIFLGLVLLAGSFLNGEDDTANRPLAPTVDYPGIAKLLSARHLLVYGELPSRDAVATWMELLSAMGAAKAYAIAGSEEAQIAFLSKCRMHV